MCKATTSLADLFNLPRNARSIMWRSVSRRVLQLAQQSLRALFHEVPGASISSEGGLDATCKGHGADKAISAQTTASLDSRLPANEHTRGIHRIIVCH
mmetsp:Transcript_92033/g.143510  ORF Transcript_92033/g.143510 Transcript_92033/m.143510 type:complete len:98 (+) Transcript_92033:84-377(+)